MLTTVNIIRRDLIFTAPYLDSKPTKSKNYQTNDKKLIEWIRVKNWETRKWVNWGS